MKESMSGHFASLATIALSAAVFSPSAAFAGVCPADKVGVDMRAMSDTPAKRVEDAVIASIDVAKEPVKIDGRQFRLRRLTIQPGGEVPWHSHGDRPAIIYVVQGTVTQYASTCFVPIVPKTGEAIPDLHATSHWWKNTGKSAAVLLSSDLFPVGVDARAM